MRSCLLLSFVALTAGCAARPAGGVGLSPPASSQAPSAGASPEQGGMPSLDLGKLGPGSHGPYLASHADHALAVVATQGPDGVLSLLAQPLDEQGNPSGERRTLGPAPRDTSLLTLRAGPDGGFCLAWARTMEGGNAVEAMMLDAAGAPRGKTAQIYQGAEAPVWLDVVAVEGGAHVYFTLPGAGVGRVLAQELSASGVSKGPVSVAAESALAWHPVSAGKGSLLLAVVPREKGALRGQVVSIRLDEGARPRPAEVLSTSDAERDVDAVAFSDRVVVGWNDPGTSEARVQLLSLSLDGKPQGKPAAPLRGVSDQALVGLVAGRDGKLLVMWDDTAISVEEGRRLRLSTLPAALGAPIDEATVDYGLRDDTAPLLQAAPWGYTFLTLTQACKADADCKGAAVWPTLLKVGPDLSLLGQAPVTVRTDEPPGMAWGVHCTQQACLALGIDATAQPSARAIRLDPPEGSWRPAFHRQPGDKAPSLSALDSLWAGPRIAELSVAPSADGWMAATITDHHEGSAPPPLPADADRKAELEKDRAQAKSKLIAPRSAIVTMHPLDATGKPSSSPKTLSVRALSSPGVAVAADKQGGACVAWVARDNGDPEVFLTKVARDGKRASQQTLTHAKGDVLDVAIAPVEDGWLVVWIDTRDGNGEVYAARVDASLRRKGAEQRITNAAGDASDLALLVRDKTAIVAFSDARNAPKDGVGDVYVARLKTDDATRMGEETRVAITPEHSRALQLQPLGDETLLAWLEQPTPTASGDKPGQIHMTTLDASGSLRALPEPLPLGIGGPLSSLAVSCEGAACQFLVTRPEGKRSRLAAFLWQRGQREATPRDLTSLLAGAAADVTPALGPGWALLGDDGPPGEGRLRRVGVRWR